MRNRTLYLLGFLMIFIWACSSKEKKEMAPEGTEAKMEETKSDMNDKKMELKKDMKKSEAKMGDGATCSMDGDERTIRIDHSDGNCMVMYKKMGEEKEVANGISSGNHCQSIKDRIMSNLENAGFSCK